MRKPANESSQPYRQELPGICTVQEKWHARGLQEAGAGPAGTPHPAQGPLCVISLIIKTLMKVCTSPQCDLLPLPVLQDHLCWLSTGGEVPSSQSTQQWVLAQILWGVNVDHDARETGFPAVHGENGPSLGSQNVIH